MCLFWYNLLKNYILKAEIGRFRVRPDILKEMFFHIDEQASIHYNSLTRTFSSADIYSGLSFSRGVICHVEEI